MTKSVRTGAHCGFAPRRVSLERGMMREPYTINKHVTESGRVKELETRLHEDSFLRQHGNK